MVKVSVIVHTYNHENYIRQTLDSILNQQVNFEFEVIVGDDASPDSTPKIIQEYQGALWRREPGNHSFIIGPRKNS